MSKTLLSSAHPRVLCESCELPTRLVPWGAPFTPDFASATNVCPLCQWENAPVDADGETIAEAPEASTDRNGGHSLEEAQANFHRFLSMYDPARPEPWMPAPPTRAEERQKERLVRAYKSLLDRFNVDRDRALEEVLELEGALAAAFAERTDAAIEDGDIAVEASDDALDEGVEVEDRRGEESVPAQVDEERGLTRPRDFSHHDGLASYYSRLSDDAVRAEAAQGEAAFRPEAWSLIQAEIARRNATASTDRADAAAWEITS